MERGYSNTGARSSRSRRAVCFDAAIVCFDAADVSPTATPWS